MMDNQKLPDDFGGWTENDAGASPRPTQNASPPTPDDFGGWLDEDKSLFETAKEAGLSGLREGLTSTAQGAQVAAQGGFKGLSPQRVQHDATTDLLNKPLSDGWKRSDWWAAQISHGLAASAPSLAMGVAGAAGGEVVAGPAGALAGGAAGFGVGSALQTIAPAYQKAVAEGLEHDAAVDRAMKETGIAASIGAAMGAAPGISVFGKTAEGALKRPISEALTQIFGVQPGLMAGQKAATNVVEGNPVGEGVAESAIVGAVTGLPLVGAHALLRQLPHPKAPIDERRAVFEQGLQQGSGSVADLTKAVEAAQGRTIPQQVAEIRSAIVPEPGAETAAGEPAASGEVSTMPADAGAQPAPEAPPAPEAETSVLKAAETRLAGDGSLISEKTPISDPSADAVPRLPEAAGKEPAVDGAVSVMPEAETFADVAKQEGLTPGSAEYETRYKTWSADQAEASHANEKARRVAEGQAAADRANGWRYRVIDWMKSASDGDIIEGDAGERYVLRIGKFKKTGEETRTLVPDNEDAMPVVTLRGGKPVGKIEATVDPNHGGREADSAGALDTIGKGLEDGTHKVSSAPPPAVDAAVKASAEIRQAETTGNLASIPQAVEAAAAAPAEGGPAGVFMFDPTALKVDAKRFQFKEGGNEQGVTTALKGVTKWDRAKGNQVIVWQDKGGDFYVVDGHQRSGLARRLIESGKEQKIELPGLLYREADGVSAEDVRAIAAVKNIAEGSGSALDGAKVLRSRPDLMDGSLPLSEGKGRQAAALAKLDDEAFRMVVNEVIEPNQGAIVGERIPNDGPRQIAAIKAIAKFRPGNETEASVLVQRVAQAELAKAEAGAQGSMFGDFETADSTAGQEMQIVGRLIKELQKDKTLFQRVVANASRIEETGSNIERASAKEVTTEAELFARRLASDAYSPGPLRDELVAAARDLKNDKIQIGEATARIRSALRGAAEDDGDARTGNRGRSEQGTQAGANPGEPVGGPEISATERTAAGDQQLIPGVKPVTDADRIAIDQSRGLTGGNEPPGGMFDEGNTRQSQLFLKRRGGRGPQGPDAANRRRSNREQLPDSQETIIGPTPGVSDAEARSFRRDEIMRQIATDLGRAFKVDSRIAPGALGSYKPQQGVLRVRYSGDVEVFTHELGHAIDQALDSDPGAQAAWRGLRSAQPSELAPLAPGQPIEEGVAEFTRLYITNPMAAMREAPITTQAFQAILNARPKIAKAIADAQKLSQVESGLAPHQVMEAMIAPQSHGALAKFSAEVKRQGLVPTIADYASAVYQGVIGRDQAFSRFANALREVRFQKTQRPLPLTFSNDPYTLYRRLPGAEQAAIGAVRDGIRPYGDVTGAPISTPLAKHIEDALGGSVSRLENDNDPLVRAFNGYLIARRARGEWGRWETGDLRNQPVNASKNEVLKAIDYYEANFPHFVDAANGVFSFMRANLQRQVDAGLIPQSIANELMNRGVDYVPYFRDLGAEKASGKSGPKSSGLEHLPFMEYSGSTRDILNPIRSILQSVSISERMIARNDVWKALDRWAEEAGELAGQWWEVISNTDIKANSVDIAEAIKQNVRSAGGTAADAELAIRQLESMIGNDLSAIVYKHEGTTTKGERVAFFWKNGERVAVKVGDNQIATDFFDLMTSMSAPERDLLIKSVSAGNAMFQSMIVHAPRFVLGTLVRDNITRMFTPRYMGAGGRIPFSQDLSGLYTLLFDRAFYKAWAAAGATRGGIYTHAARELQSARDPYMAINGGKNFIARTAEELSSAPTLAGKVKAVATTPAKLLSDALKIIESGETISRLGVAKRTFNYLKGQGLSDHEALIGALHESKDVLPYERNGSWMHGFARAVPFLNAGIQGADRAVRGLVAEPVQSAMTAYRRGGIESLDANQRLALSNAAKNWMYIGAMAGITGGIYYPFVKDSDFYKNASEYLRENYFLIPTGHDKDGNPTGLTLHKPYDLPSVLINGVENFMRYMDGTFPKNTSLLWSSLKELFPRQFHSATDALGAFTLPKTAMEVALGKKLGFDGGKPKDIVPEGLQGRAPEDQYDAMSSWASKQIGATFGVSPKIVDHVIDSLGGTGGQDIKDFSTAVFDDNPLTNPGDALNRAFFGQIYRTQRGAPGVRADLQDLMARDHGSYMQAANQYQYLLEEGERGRAEELYNRSDDETKAFMVVMAHHEFNTEVKQLHPLIHAQKIAEIVYNLDRDLNRKSVSVQDFGHQRGDERKYLSVTDDQARKLHSVLNQIVTEETRNGLKIAGEPGYEGFNVLPSLQERAKIVAEINPEVGKELMKRVKHAHILPADGLAQVWPEAQARLLKSQKKARLHDLLSQARRLSGGFDRPASEAAPQ